jgi:hypothetical protein
MRLDHIKEVVGTIDVQILALVTSGVNTQSAIVGVLAPRVLNRYQNVIDDRRDQSTVTRHVEQNIQKGFLSSVEGTLVATPRGTEVLRVLRELKAIDDQMPPHVIGVIGYSPQIRVPDMILGSLIYVGPAVN